MTIFAYTWNSAFLALPGNSEQESLGAQRIRETKAAVGERLAVCFSLAGNANDGLCTGLTFLNTEATGSNPQLFLGNSADGNAELYFTDNNNNTTQLTNSGVVNAPVSVPSGSRVAFLQAAVPVGWTHDPTLNDCVIRINGSSGGGNGGSWTISGITVQNHTLVLSELPTTVVSINTGSQSLNGSGGTLDNYNPVGGNGHSHGFSADGTWRPSYTDSVVGVKN